MADPSLPTLAARLAWARTRAGMSALGLSREAGLRAGGHVGLIESGEIERPQGDTLAALARVLGCSMDWLQTGAGNLTIVADAIDAARVARAVAKAAPVPVESTTPLDGDRQTHAPPIDRQTHPPRIEPAPIPAPVCPSPTIDGGA